MEHCYYSLIRRALDGLLIGWIPDLPGVTASSMVEEQIKRELSRGARELLDKMTSKGLPPPKASSADDLPLGDQAGRYRRLLLVLTQDTASTQA